MTNDGSVNSEYGGKTLFDFFHQNHDRVIVGKVPESNETPATGMDRLKRMFSLDPYGEQSKEITMITQTFCATTFGGAIIGAIVQSRDAFVNFLQNNEATKFQSQLDAKRELQRVMYLAFSKGAWRWGSRVGMFTFSFTSLMTAVSVYRGKESVVEYIVAGGVTGALFKMNMGLKGAFSGCLAGSFLGGIAGGASMLVLKLGGTSMDELRSFSKLLKDTRTEAWRQKEAEYTLSQHPEYESLKDAGDASYKNLKGEEQDEKQ